jgi:hypothetical protein
MRREVVIFTTSWHTISRSDACQVRIRDGLLDVERTRVMKDPNNDEAHADHRRRLPRHVLPERGAAQLGGMEAVSMVVNATETRSGGSSKRVETA